MENTILDIKHISKHFFSKGDKTNELLKDVSFSIESNTINCIIGGNGTGKTTLFNIISRLQDPSHKKSKIFYKGKDLTKVKPKSLSGLGIARTFQGIQVYNSLSILDNMLLQVNNQNFENPFQSLFFTKRIKLEEEALKHKALDILKTNFGEDSLFFQKPNNLAAHLSFGQKRLLSLAGLLMGDQDLILLDEPTSGVNPKLVSCIKNIIFGLKTQGKTILVIEHNMKFVKAIADKVLFLNKKHIEMQGSATEILDHTIVKKNYLGY